MSTSITSKKNRKKLSIPSIIKDEQTKSNKRKYIKTNTEENDSTVVLKHEGTPTEAKSEMPQKKFKEDTDEINDSESYEKRTRSVRWNDLEVKDRTVFVGNIPVNTEKKSLQKLFSEYGKIEAIRIRGVIPADPKVPKKVAYITKNIHPKVKSLQSYIVFVSANDVNNALKANGKQFNGHHLRVDRATPTTQHNQKNAIFIGNLPFEVEEDTVWDIFQECGKIESVRLIRDKATGVGKGFGYVNFDNSDAVELALQLENVTVGKRTIRVQRIGTPGKKNKKRNADGKKARRIPRVKNEMNETQSNNQVVKKKPFESNFQGSQFKTKKKVKKVNKGDMKKKKLIKLLTPKKK